MAGASDAGMDEAVAQAMVDRKLGGLLAPKEQGEEEAPEGSSN